MTIERRENNFTIKCFIDLNKEKWRNELSMMKYSVVQNSYTYYIEYIETIKIVAKLTPFLCSRRVGEDWLAIKITRPNTTRHLLVGYTEISYLQCQTESKFTELKQAMTDKFSEMWQTVCRKVDGFIITIIRLIYLVIFYVFDLLYFLLSCIILLTS